MLKKDGIGAILRERIKEVGYTQEEFAEKAGIGISSLKKYMNGTTAYSYELLGVFAELLDCSFDYLLGMSNSTKREYESASELLRLSDGAIEKIARYAKDYDIMFEAKRYIKSLDAIIKSDGLINCMADYFLGSRYIEQAFKMIEGVAEKKISENSSFPEGCENDIYVLNCENFILIYLVSLIKQTKQEISTEILEELKAVAPLEQVKEQLGLS